MTIDYYLSLSSIVTGIVTNSPVLQAVPTAFRLTATCFPRLFPLGLTKRLTSEEKVKLEKIKSLLPGICQDLGIKDSVKIHLRVSRQLGANACMIGTTTSSFGGPVLCLGDTFFKNYESISLPENSDFREWLGLLDEIPNTPVELGKYLDGCDKEKRERIKGFAKKFKDVLSKEELESILAHELGHAKHHHLLKTSGLLLVILTADKLAQVFANTIGFGIHYALASLPLLLLSVEAISRIHETEADGECGHSNKYQKGMLNFHKKELIDHLFQNATSSFESNAAKMLQKVEWKSSHPNFATRLQHAIVLSQDQPHPKTAMTRVAWVLAGLGALNLAGACYSDACGILGVQHRSFYSLL
jgi:hypothetical protein